MAGEFGAEAVARVFGKKGEALVEFALAKQGKATKNGKRLAFYTDSETSRLVGEFLKARGKEFFLLGSVSLKFSGNLALLKEKGSKRVEGELGGILAKKIISWLEKACVRSLAKGFGAKNPLIVRIGGEKETKGKKKSNVIEFEKLRKGALSKKTRRMRGI